MSDKRILIVDDELIIRNMVEFCLSGLGIGFEITTAADGNLALNQIKEQTIDLLVTDYSMPGMTGLQLIEETRRISPSTMSVLMTGLDSDELREAITQAQLDGFLAKPFNISKLLELVDQLLGCVSV